MKFHLKNRNPFLPRESWIVKLNLSSAIRVPIGPFFRRKLQLELVTRFTDVRYRRGPVQLRNTYLLCTWYFVWNEQKQTILEFLFSFGFAVWRTASPKEKFWCWSFLASLCRARKDIPFDSGFPLWTAFAKIHPVVILKSCVFVRTISLLFERNNSLIHIEQ